MIARVGSGWQTVLADLSLILFLVAAAAVVGANGRSAALQPSERSDPIAIYHAEDGAPSIEAWLANQQADERQLLTVTARYAPGGADHALREAARLVQQAGRAGHKVRVLVEPGSGGTSAVLAYDMPAD